jgi:hypothetical protein
MITMEFEEDIRLPKDGNIRRFLPRGAAARLLIIFQQLYAMRGVAQPQQWPGDPSGPCNVTSKE